MKLENFGMNDRIFGETGHRDGTEQVMGQEKKALLKLSLRELKINKVHLPYLLKKFFVNKSGCFGRLCSCWIEHMAAEMPSTEQKVIFHFWLLLFFLFPESTWRRVQMGGVETWFSAASKWTTRGNIPAKPLLMAKTKRKYST